MFITTLKPDYQNSWFLIPLILISVIYLKKYIRIQHFSSSFLKMFTYFFIYLNSRTRGKTIPWFTSQMSATDRLARLKSGSRNSAANWDALSESELVQSGLELAF